MNRAAQAASFRFRLDAGTGVPVYRQIIDQVMVGIATGALKGGGQLPTVRQMAVDLAVNPNTVVRAYRELEIRGVLTSQQGTGTFITAERVQTDDAERQRQLTLLVSDFVARAGSGGFAVEELMERLKEFSHEQPKKRR